MESSVQSIPLTVLLIGLIISAAVGIRTWLDRTNVPALVGFIGLGLLLRLLDDRLGILSGQGDYALEVLAELGIIALLFRVGLESDLAGLRRQLGHASILWIGNIALSAVPGYFVMTWLLGYGQIPSLISAVALSATSIGVSVGMWRKHDRLNTENGRLLTDVAEMDDISGLALMVMLFAIVPMLHEPGSNGSGSGQGIWTQLLTTGGWLFLKFVGFTGLCVAFSRYAEEPMTHTFERYATDQETIVFIAGVGITIAGIAAWLGFSAALGALFAGFAFSRDPESVKFDSGFAGLYHLFSPFFFIGIGLSFDTGAFSSAIGTGAALVAVAVIGKVVGAGVPALFVTGTTGAALLSVSMVPRAEITMIIMERGSQLGDWAVPSDLYAAFVVVSAATCVIAPVSLEFMFRRWARRHDEHG